MVDGPLFIRQGLPDELSNGGGVMALHVLLASQGRDRTVEGLLRQREHLKASAIEGNEVLVDEAIASVQVAMMRKLQKGAERVRMIEAETMAVGGQHQQQVEQQLVCQQGGKEALSKEPMRDKCESSSPSASHSLGNDGGALKRWSRTCHGNAPVRQRLLFLSPQLSLMGRSASSQPLLPHGWLTESQGRRQGGEHGLSHLPQSLQHRILREPCSECRKGALTIAEGIGQQGPDGCPGICEQKPSSS